MKMRKSKVMRSMMALLVCVFFVQTVSFADAGADAKALSKLVEKLEKQVDELQGEIKELKKNQVPSKLEEDVKCLQRDFNTMRVEQERATRVPTVPADVGQVPTWLEGTHFGGDLRVRYQPRSNNKTPDRNRFRVRLRYGVSKQLNDELKAAFRLATGSTANRRDYHETLGNTTTDFDKYDVWVDQAYLKYTPNWLENLTLYGGKFPQNWKDKGILIHPEGCGFDGFGQSYVYQITDDLKVDINLAQLIYAEGAGLDADGEMYVFDTGLSGCYEEITWGLRGTAYLFTGLQDSGSTLNAGVDEGDFRTLVGTIDLGFDVQDIPVALFTQGAVNTNTKDSGGDTRSQQLFWAAGIGINKLQKPGDWALGYKYAYLEGQVMPSDLPDADLAAIGDGGQMQWLWAQYRLFDHTDLSATLLLPREVDGDQDSDTVIAKIQIDTRF